MDTKQQIMDVAERLFAEEGFDASSLRRITAEAGVNLAAVNYHFRSKEGLLDAVLARRILPMNTERLHLLQTAVDEAGEKPPPLEAVVEALIAPALRAARSIERGEMFTRLLGRIYSEPRADVKALVMPHFREIEERFLPVLRLCLGHLSESELLSRCLFLIGAMAQTMCDAHQHRTPAGREIERLDVERVIRRLVTFVCAGLRAAASPGEAT